MNLTGRLFNSLTDAEKDALKDARIRGNRIADISNEFGIAESTATHWLRKLGVHYVKQSAGELWTDDELSILKSMVLEGKKSREIAKVIGRSAEAVHVKRMSLRMMGLIPDERKDDIGMPVDVEVPDINTIDLSDKRQRRRYQHAVIDHAIYKATIQYGSLAKTPMYDSCLIQPQLMTQNRHIMRESDNAK